MKRLLLTVLATFTLSAQASVLNFDDITGVSNYNSITSLGQTGYGGFAWDTQWYVGNTSESNYGGMASSGTQYMSNGNNVNNLSIGNGATFTFDGAYFGAPTHSAPADWINITAYDALNNIIGTTGNVNISQGSMQWVAGGFAGVSYLNITRENGWFAMDDFTYNTSVPGPAGLGLFALGLLLMRMRKTA